MDDIKLAMLGSKEAAKRLTDAGALVQCPFCGAKKPSVYQHTFSELPDCFGIKCYGCGAQSYQFFDTEEEARLAWNSRAPILSSREMEMLEGME